MSATVTLLATDNRRAFVDFAAGNRLATWDQATLELIIPSADQAAIDAKLIDYHADQANIDTDFADKRADAAKDQRKDEFDDKSDLTALIKEMVDQLNELRALHSLPPLIFGQVNSDIRNRID